MRETDKNLADWAAEQRLLRDGPRLSIVSALEEAELEPVPADFIASVPIAVREEPVSWLQLCFGWLLGKL